MTIHQDGRRPLGTMVAYGFTGPAGKADVGVDLEIARRLGASVVEVLPDWRAFPAPEAFRARVAEFDLSVHSAHGCWGGQSIRAARVDLGSLDPATHRASVDDLRACADWLERAGGTVLVVHPGGLSDPDEAGARRDALRRGLVALADHVRGTSVAVCVENMPPGVHPGSRSADLAAVVAGIDRPEVALALDTGHALIASTPGEETRAAGRWLRTTHVHDNDGRHDTHLPPGHGVLDWPAWREALDEVGYRGPIMLECIRHLRRSPEAITDDLLALLRRLTELPRA